MPAAWCGIWGHKPSHGLVPTDGYLDAPGTVDDAYFRFVIDMGAPGPDRGKGGKYLFVGPGYEGDLPKEGYFIIESPTYTAWQLTRSFVKDVGLAASTLIRSPEVHLPVPAADTVIEPTSRSVGEALKTRASWRLWLPWWRSWKNRTIRISC